MKASELKEGQAYVLSPDMYSIMTENQQLMLKSMIYVYKAHKGEKFYFDLFMDDAIFEKIVKNIFKHDEPVAQAPDTFHTEETLCEEEVELLIEKNFDGN